MSRVSPLLVHMLILSSMGFLAPQALAQPDSVDAILARQYEVEVEKDVLFCSPGGTKLYLDVYQPTRSAGLRPALLLVHGGGWGGRDKSHSNFVSMANSFAARGMVVFNVNYRLSGTHPAPAAVQDVHCAARFIHAHAERYRVDPKRISATGNSAGCHLVLMVAMCDSDICSGKGDWQEYPHTLRAVVNRFAITDAFERAFVQKRKSALRWFTGVEGDPKNLAKRMSPVNYTYVSDLPPILTIHGEKDFNTPVEQGIRLHQGLLKSGNTSELFVVPGGNHGLHNLSSKQREEVERRTFAFLLKHGALNSSS